MTDKIKNLASNNPNKMVVGPRLRKSTRDKTNAAACLQGMTTEDYVESLLTLSNRKVLRDAGVSE